MSDYAITIKETATSAPLVGATVAFYNTAGSQLAAIAADNNGQVNLNLDEDGGLFAAGNTFKISLAGYASVSAPVSELVATDTVYLDKLTSTAVKSNTGIVVVGVLAVLGILYFSKKLK